MSSSFSTVAKKQCLVVQIHIKQLKVNIENMTLIAFPNKICKTKNKIKY